MSEGNILNFPTAINPRLELVADHPEGGQVSCTIDDVEAVNLKANDAGDLLIVLGASKVSDLICDLRLIELNAALLRKTLDPTALTDIQKQMYATSTAINDAITGGVK